MKQEYEKSNYYQSFVNLCNELRKLNPNARLSDGGDTWTVYGLEQALSEGYHEMWMCADEDLYEAEDYALQRRHIVQKNESGWETVYWLEEDAW